MAHAKVIVIDFGAQLACNIVRETRELGYHSAIFLPKQAEDLMERYTPEAIILSGGKSSIYESGAPQVPQKVFTLRRPSGDPVPVLGICYGMQAMAHAFGGHVGLADSDYGNSSIELLEPQDEGSIFANTSQIQTVWTSHGDSVLRAPPGFKILARSPNGAIAAMEHREKRCFAVQFHPEATQTVYGKKILGNFLRLAGCRQDWSCQSVIQLVREEVLAQVGDQIAAIGFSGGVDSTTLAKILSPALGKQLVAMVIDAGQLREGELEEIKLHAQAAGVMLHVIDAREEFLTALAGITDADEKRDAFSLVYTRILAKEARLREATIIIQASLAPDFIESGATGGDRIKKHHNIGNDWGDLAQLHPFRELFKHEVRALARQLGLPKSVVERQPFPGPGLIIRILEPITVELLDLVRWADAQVREVFTHYPDERISQLVVGYVGINLKGVRGDGECYDGCIIVRAVHTVDFMTAKGLSFAQDVADHIKRALVSCGRAVIVDISDKPPRTVELQ